MKDLILGFKAWASLKPAKNDTIRVVDTGITVVGTLLIAVGYAAFHV